jgi:hypothetical protein
MRRAVEIFLIFVMIRRADARMSKGTILFIHGTGVRSSSYEPGFRDAAARAEHEKIPYRFESCPWGDVFGARFSPKSLPRDEFSQELDEEEEKDVAHWSFLFEDPLFELRMLTIRDSATDPAAELSCKPKYRELLDKIAAYHPRLELGAILKREQLTDYWQPAFDAVFKDPLTEQAFRLTGDGTVESSDALARALVAKMTALAEEAGHTGPGREGRKALVDRMKQDWGQQVLGVGRFFSDLFAKPATHIAKQRRSQWTRAITNPIGDILLYQSRGREIRNYLKAKIAEQPAPVVLMAHSLGGIASVDLLASGEAQAHRLITFGSQAPFLYELGALESMKPPEQPKSLPPWLNLWDENDFLSYLAKPVFGKSCNVTDVKIRTGRPFPASHSAYLGSAETWAAIRHFLA